MNIFVHKVHVQLSLYVHCYVRQLYEQLLNEAPSERFDERRVLLLKSQIIQLERQVNTLMHTHIYTYACALKQYIVSIHRYT